MLICFFFMMTDDRNARGDSWTCGRFFTFFNEEINLTQICKIWIGNTSLFEF